MNSQHITRFENDGFTLCDSILDAERCALIQREIDALDFDSVGSRNLLQMTWCASLADEVHQHPQIASLIPDALVPVQCTFFEKSAERNWLVSFHQDLSIPVQARLEHAELSGWSLKEGRWYVQPPLAVLESLIAVRVHIDPCSIDDGPLHVLRGTHRLGRLSPESITSLQQKTEGTPCCVAPGGALVMRPLLLHASSKSSGTSRRRVLHFVFAPPTLPLGLRW